MELFEVALTGCTAEPMMNYLKALGVFRIVAEQVDVDARAFWRSEVLVVQSGLDREGLETFFLAAYRPTPFLAPWGARSGFFTGASGNTPANIRPKSPPMQYPRTV